MKRTAAIILFVTTAMVNAHAQNNTSPYSIIGIGDIEKGSFDRTTGTGYAGVALSSNQALYHINPASYSALDNFTFYGETSLRYKSISYSGNAIGSSTASSSSDLVTKKIAFGIKIKDKWGLSFGLLPFSTSNYSFDANKSVQGTPFSTPAFYQGSGSMNQAYLANSYRFGGIFQGLSLGLQASYLFGQFQQEETISTSIGNGALYTKKNLYLNKAYFKAGLQYQHALNKKWRLALGATASNKTVLNANYDLLVMDGSQTLENNPNYQSGYFTIPLSYTTGIAAVLKEKYIFAIDYDYQDWSSTHTTGLNYSLVNSNRISAGFEVSNKKNIIYNGRAYSIERSYFQAGFFHNNSYLKIAGQQISEYGVTLGYGLNGFKGLGVKAALEVGSRGTTSNGLIKENYTQFTITLSLREFWQVKAKRFD